MDILEALMANTGCTSSPVKVSTDDSVPELQSKHEESAGSFQPANKNMAATNGTQTHDH